MGNDNGSPSENQESKERATVGSGELDDGRRYVNVRCPHYLAAKLTENGTSKANLALALCDSLLARKACECVAELQRELRARSAA